MKLVAVMVYYDDSKMDAIEALEKRIQEIKEGKTVSSRHYLDEQPVNVIEYLPEDWDEDELEELKLHQ